MEATHIIEGVVLPPLVFTPNFAHTSYVSGGIVPLSAVFLTLSTLSLALRFYIRVKLLRAFFAEDYVIIAAWVFTTTLTAICLEEQQMGNGRHQWDIPLETFVSYSRWAAAAILIYVPATALPKVAILMCYLRVFPNKKFKIAVYVIFTITVAYIITSWFAFSTQCDPVAKMWNVTIPGHCSPIPKLLANGLFNVTIDVMVLLVPVPMLMEWDAGTRQKCLTGGMFAIGSSTCIVSAVRSYYIARLLHTSDITRVIVIPTSLGVVETNLSIVCGCLMVMRPFLRRHLPFLPGIRSERVEQTSPDVANDDQPLTVLNIHIEYRGNLRAGLGGINSSAGWIWDQRRTRTQTTVGTATEDVEMGGVRGWPLRNDSLLRTDCRDNIIQEPRTSWSAHNKYSTQRP